MGPWSQLGDVFCKGLPQALCGASEYDVVSFREPIIFERGGWVCLPLISGTLNLTKPNFDYAIPNSQHVRETPTGQILFHVVKNECQQNWGDSTPS